METISQIRSNLYTAWSNFGRKPSHSWIPHLSLMYAPNPTLAQEARTFVKVIGPIIADKLGNTSLEFSAAGLFGFDRMDRFFKRA